MGFARTEERGATVIPIWLIDDLIASSKYGRGVKIEWARGGRPGADAERLLRAYGVRVWGRQISYKGDQPWGVRVRANQAGFADALMNAAGFPVLTPDRGKRRSMPYLPRRAWGVPAKPVGLAGTFVKWMGGEFSQATLDGWRAAAANNADRIAPEPEKTGKTPRKRSRGTDAPKKTVSRRGGPEKRGSYRGSYRRA